MKNIRITIILCLFWLISATVFAQTENEASSTVEKFYKFHRTRSGIISTHELNLRKGWFSAELTNLFRYEIKREDEFVRKNHDEKPYFGDGFPFQPFEECVVNNKIILNKLEIGITEIKANKAIVEVKFFIPKECETEVKEKLLETYKVELIKAKNRWLISDWIFSDNQRLTDILKREKY